MGLSRSLLACAVLAGSALAAAGAGGAAPARDDPAVAVVTARGIVLVQDGNRLQLPGTRPGDAEPSWSPDGTRLVLSRRVGADRELAVIDVRTGETQPVRPGPGALDVSPAWSPDGRRIAWARGKPGAWEVWVADLETGKATRLEAGPGSELDPAWSADAKRLAFTTDETGDLDVHELPLAGGDELVLAGGSDDERRPAWSPDGSQLAVAIVTPRGGNLAIVGADGFLRSLTGGAGVESRPDWTRDGSAVVFERPGNARGIWLVDPRDGRVRPLEGSRAGDRDPAVAPAGAELGPDAGELLPDLDQRAPAGLMVRAQGTRRFLGFHSAVDNVGRVPLRIVGRRDSTTAPTMHADQVIPLAGGGRRIARDVGVLRYESHNPHRHWHLEPFERYELRRLSDHTLVARDRKAGFCLADRYGHAASRVSVPVVARFPGTCGQGQPGLLTVEQGSSPGFTDRYPAWFHGQEIEITGVAPGTYVLVHRANPDLRMRESRYDNNAASVLIRLGPAGVTVLARCEGSARCGPPAPA